MSSMSSQGPAIGPIVPREDGVPAESGGAAGPDAVTAIGSQNARAFTEAKPALTRSRSVNVDDIEPTRFETFIVQRPCCACCSFLAAALFFSMMAGAMFQSKVVVLATEDQWDVVGDPVVMQFSALQQGKDQSPSASIRQGAVAERSVSLSSITIIYEVNDGNIMSDLNLDKIRKVESVIVGDAKYQEHCLLTYAFNGTEGRCRSPNTPLKLAARAAATHELQTEQGFGPCGATPFWQDAADTCGTNSWYGHAPCTSAVFDPVSDEAPLDADRVSHLRCVCCASRPEDGGCADLPGTCLNSDESAQLPCTASAQELNAEQAKFSFGADLSCSDGSSKRARSMYSFGFPLQGYSNTDSDEDNDKMKELLEQWTTGDLYRALAEAKNEVSDGNFNVYFSGAGTDSVFFMSSLQGDLFFAIGSFAVVFLWLWFGTTSAFLASVGMTEIILSIPLAIFMWGVMQSKFLTFFTLCILFLILGIGADDIFVLWDAYQQADAHFENRSDGTPERKFAYALRRARGAMTVTSATTFFSMLAAGITPIPSISSFGIFGAFVVAFDFLLVITLFASAMVVFQTHFKSWSGPCTLINRGCGKCTRDAGGEGEGEKLRPPERFFRERWTPLVQRFKLPIALFWLVLFVAAVCVVGAKLRLTTEGPQFFNDEYGSRWFEVFAERDGFVSSSDTPKVQVHVVLGMDRDNAVDRTGTNARDPEDLGTPNLDPSSIRQLSTPDGQLALWGLCEDARSGLCDRVDRDENCSSELRPHPLLGAADSGPRVRVEPTGCQTGAVCFIDWVRDYRMEAEGRTAEDWHEQSLAETLSSKAFSPGATDEEAGFPCGQCCEVQGWYVCKIYAVRTSYGLQDLSAWLDMSRYYLSGGELQWGYVSLNSTMPPEALPLDVAEDHYSAWSTFVDGRVGSYGAYHTSAIWPFMVLQETLMRSVVQSIGVCLILAWVILCLATSNWIMATLSLLCIIAILIVFAGCLPIFGFSLGIFESVGLIVVLGLSVDYTVHIAHSYNEARVVGSSASPAAERAQRASHALTEMGISVLSGAITSLLASLFLLPSKFMFYHVFGVFMLTAVVVSSLVSLTLLPALLMLFGPAGSAGDLPWVQQAFGWVSFRVGRCCRTRAAASAAVAAK
ncbi:unnamed protein product [Prorocentrum cordatum]|uniref:SSD domain-containing protein n=1 Tax=Prorocentrum cordatum TaxID=2364126 RepID=A0ABN9T3I4_9DINO|nr:unnamed protein product [Polarella glacialis]